MSNHSDKIKSLRPRFVGKNELRVSIRRIGVHRKIAVTVINYSPLTVNVATSDRRAKIVAIEEARKHGASSTDYTLLPGGEVSCNALNSDGKKVPIRVRSSTFYFAAVD